MRSRKMRQLSVKESYFKNLVGRLLKEAPEAEEEDGEDSLDAQVDKYFASYESEAKNAKNEGLNMRLISRRFLMEAEEDEEKKEDEEGEKEEKPAEDKKLTAEDIDVKSFATDVMRLVDNYDTLLEIRNTVLRRATNFLVKNYDPSVSETFKEELLESFGVEIGKTKSEEQDEFQAPKAGAAGPMGGSA